MATTRTREPHIGGSPASPQLWMYPAQASKDIETIRQAHFERTETRITGLEAIEIARDGRPVEFSPIGTPANERVSLIDIQSGWLREAASKIEMASLEDAVRP